MSLEPADPQALPPRGLAADRGLAPSAHVVVVTFDPDGRLIPFEAEGYFVGRSHIMNFDDGYWITNVYSVDQGRWH